MMLVLTVAPVLSGSQLVWASAFLAALVNLKRMQAF
jgi:hypothetical protein